MKFRKLIKTSLKAKCYIFRGFNILYNIFRGYKQIISNLSHFPFILYNLFIRSIFTFRDDFISFFKKYFENNFNIL